MSVYLFSGHKRIRYVYTRQTRSMKTKIDVDDYAWVILELGLSRWSRWISWDTISQLRFESDYGPSQIECWGNWGVGVRYAQLWHN